MRVLAALLAGALHMPWRRFVLCNFLGAAVWVAAICSAGYLFGGHWARLVHDLKRFDLAVLVVVVVARGCCGWWRNRSRRRRLVRREVPESFLTRVLAQRLGNLLMHRADCRSAAILCGCRGRLGAKGSAAVDFSGGVRAGIRTRRKRMKKTRVLDTLDYGNASIGPGLPGGGDWSEGASTGGSGGGSSASPGPPRQCHLIRTSMKALEAMRSAKHHLESAEGEFRRPPAQSDRASRSGDPRGGRVHAMNVDLELERKGSVHGRCLFSCRHFCAAYYSGAKGVSEGNAKPNTRSAS